MKKNKGKKFIIFLAVILLIILIYDIYIRVTYYEWEFVKNYGSKIQIMVEDELYTEYDTYIDWQPIGMYNRHRIGTNLFSLCDEDLGLFLMVDRPIAECDEIYFIKDGVALPEFCNENVDTVEFIVPAYNPSTDETYLYGVTDRKIIDALFECMENTVEIDFIEYRDKGQIARIAELAFLNNEIKDIEVNFEISAMGNKYYIMVEPWYTYAEISREFLSQLSGYNIPETYVFYDMTTIEIYEYFGIDYDKWEKTRGY